VTISTRKGLVVIRSGKGDAYREVALNALVRAVFEEWTTERTGRERKGEPALFLSSKGTRISPRAADTAIRRVAGDAGLDLSAHVLRHTCLTNLVRQEARRRPRRADAEPPEPHPPREDRHGRPGLRQRHRADPGRVRAILRGDDRRADRPEPALQRRRPP